MNHSQAALPVVMAIVLGMAPGEALAGWQGRRAKCVKPDSAITAEQEQSLSAAVRGGTPVWHAAGQVDQASASATTNVVLSQGAFDQAWIRYELCMALDNNHIDQATYYRLLEQSLQGSLGQPGAASASTTSTASTTTRPPSATVASVATPATATASTDSSTAWMEQIRAQTQLRSGPEFADIAAYGYSLFDVAKTGLLDASANTTVPLNLPLGYEYAVMGVCDNDCSDLDLTVLHNGSDLAVDTSTDDWPVVPITPTSSAGYAIKVTMYQCATATCGYQLTVWQRPADTTAAPASVATPQSGGGNGVVSVRSGTRLQGALGAGDHTLPNGEWSDRYRISVQAGQSLIVSMASSNIDTYLVAQSPSGAVEGNDDCDGNRSQSCLGLVAEEGGEWTIYATSYEANDDGAYDLQVEVR